jgi:GT2 family glycosyltransferase
MTFTIMIPTRDRVRDLEFTCGRLSKLEPAPIEVLICADGCTDDTCGMLARNFPQFKVLRNTDARGSVYSRDRMLRLARGDIVVSLDDDSYPVRVDFLQQLREVFDSHPEVAVVVFSELRQGFACSKPNPERRRGCYVGAYANCGAAMRRQVYLTMPGFPRFFRHMYEEADYGLQCYAAGYAVWFEPSVEIVHAQSAMNRRVMRRHHLNARNELWSVWLRCPWPWQPLVTAYRAARQLVHAFFQGPQWVIREPWWWWEALKGIGVCREQRRAIPWRTYYGWMRLARHRTYTLNDLRARFPMSPGSAAGLSQRGGSLTKPEPQMNNNYCPR